MRRQWFFAVALLSFLAAPAMAEEKEQCPPLEVRLAEIAEEHSEEVIYQMPIASGFTLIVTASREGTWHLLVAEVDTFKVDTIGGLPIKRPLTWRACDMFYGKGGLKGPVGDDS